MKRHRGMGKLEVRAMGFFKVRVKDEAPQRHG